MIARTFRFHGYGSLNYVYRQGATVRNTLCSLRYVKNDRRKTPRVAVVVSKKVHKSAVVRNRIRRRFYEVLRQHQAAITEPYDMIFSVFSDQVAEMPYPELMKLLTSQLREAKII